MMEVIVGKGRLRQWCDERSEIHVAVEIARKRERNQGKVWGMCPQSFEGPLKGLRFLA